MKKFLSCHWENLLYVNYKVNPKEIIPFLPEDLEPVLINGETIVSLVCFEFSKAQFFGIKIPFHQYFPEINIRVYVQKKGNPEINGVYFISEMVPKSMTVFVAKYIFGEPFSLQNIRVNISNSFLQYKCNTENLHLNFSVDLKKNLSENFTEEQKFVIERTYAFCGKKGRSSKIFKVSHCPWKLFETKNAKISIHKIAHLPIYFQKVFRDQKPSSIFATDGSFVDVLKLGNIS